MRDYKLYIGGEWVDPSEGETFHSVNPFTQQPWATIAQAGQSDVDRAVETARSTFNNTWRNVSGYERSRLLNRLADEIEAAGDEMALFESTDNGKVIRETRQQMNFAARVCRFFAGYADKIWGKVIPLDRSDIFDYATFEPLGVIGLVTAWNSPMALLANKLPAALAAGNCVVVKPSEHASVTTLEFSKLVERAGFPAGVFNVVTGDGRTGQALISNPEVDKVSFTGSDRTGRHIASEAGKVLTPVTLELGGKSPNIIFSDANLDRAVVGGLAGIFSATGQTCIAGSRLLVQRPVYDEVVGRLVDRAQNIKLGNPTDFETEMGTAANEPQFNKIMSAIESGKQNGARLMTGGEAATEGDLANGLFIKPTIFADVRNDMSLAQEEIFGPVLSIIPFDEEEDAIQMANDTRYGLASGIWSNDINRIQRVSRALRVGLVWVNTYRVVSAQGPFGGVKDSGFGRERGEEGLYEFVATKNVMVDFSDTVRDPFMVQT